MKKLAVLFPGVGYTTDKPLFHYAKKILKQYEYDILEIKYTGMEGVSLVEMLNENGKDIKRISRDKVLAFVAKAEELSKQQLKKVDLSEYDRVVFVGKSIGTAIGTLCAKHFGIHPYNIMLTPLEFTLQLCENGEKGLVIYGTSDQYANVKYIQEKCHELGLKCESFNDGNHSLETGDVMTDIDYLKKYASVLNDYIEGFDKNIYDFSVLDRKNNIVKLSEYRGKVLLIVNTATGCGYTPQYQILEELYRKYNKKGFVVLDFPCNQFANQAPGSADEIYSFCSSRYEISFPQFAKIEVNGKNQLELYEYLKSKKGFAGFDMNVPDSKFLMRKLEMEDPDYAKSSDIKWNFTKFLVDRDGTVVERYEPTTDFKKIIADIDKII